MPEDPKKADDQGTGISFKNHEERSDPQGDWGIQASPAVDKPKAPESQREERSAESVESAEPGEHVEAGTEEHTESDEPAEAEQFDPEKLSPAARKEYDRLKAIETESQKHKDRATDLERKLGEQGRELGAARKLVEEKQKTHAEFMRQNEDNYLLSLQNHQDQAMAYEDAARQAREDGNADEEKRFRRLAAQELAASTQESQMYNGWRIKQEIDHARAVESVFLENHPEYKEVQNSLDGFCQDLGMNPILVRQNMEQLGKVYKRLLHSERGTDESLQKIREGAQTLALESGSKKKGASGPDSGTSGRAHQRKAERDWVAEDFGGRSDSRHNPSIVSTRT
jgi:hypothetical protein